MSRAFATTLMAIVMMSAVLGRAQTSGRLDVTKAQPLLAVSRELSKTYGWIIRYEDAPVTASQYLIRENDKNGWSGPFVRPSTISIAAVNSESINAEVRRQIIQQAIDRYNLTDAPARYGVSVADDIVRIYPTATISATGEYLAFEPLLDTLISLPLKRYQVGEAIGKVLAEVSRLRGNLIGIGILPPNLLPVEITEEASNESAYSVLDRILEAANGPRLLAGADRLVFRSELVYRPGSETYVYSATVAKRIPAPAVKPGVKPSVSSQEPQGNGRFIRK